MCIETIVVVWNISDFMDGHTAALLAPFDIPSSLSVYSLLQEGTGVQSPGSEAFWEALAGEEQNHKAVAGMAKMGRLPGTDSRRPAGSAGWGRNRSGSVRRMFVWENEGQI